MTKEEAIKYLQQLYPNGGHCWLDEQRIEAVGMAVKALQEEPVSDDLEKAARSYSNNLDNIYGSIGEQTRNAFKAGAEWQRQKDQKWIDDNRQQIFNEGYKNGSYAGRYDMYNRLFEAAATDRVVTHFLLAHSV